jgi:spoIIIJ-associated protein
VDASGELRVEATGETVGEAKWNAIRELERLAPLVDKAAVRFEVLSEGERGLLGVGYAPARVVASASADAVRPDAEPHDGESDLAGRVREVVERIVEDLGMPPHVDIAEDDTTVVASCSGRDLGLLIGKHGQTIDAVQYLVNAIVAREADEGRKDVVVDAAGYRARRTASLEALADRSAERVLASGGELMLDPMTAVERKVVHLRLRDVPGVETTSVGTEPNRAIVIRAAQLGTAESDDGAG